MSGQNTGVTLGLAALGAVAALGVTRMLTSKSEPKAAPEQPAPKGCKWSKKVVDSGLKEFSVVYTDRAYNLMSEPFQEAMRDINRVMCQVYNAHSMAIIPGSGSYAMEAVARQFGTNKKCLVMRNGFFSFRWSDIFEVCKLPSEEVVLKAHVAEGQEGEQFPQFVPFDLDAAVARIKEEAPAAVFAPHVETSTGMIIPDEYIKALADAAHSVGAVFVLDCIASGNVWVDMKATGVDALISAPQKGWTGPACAGLVMMSERARESMANEKPESNSFGCNLDKWTTVMDKYVNGGFMYYTTLPTDALMMFRDVIAETEAFGFEKCRERMLHLGSEVRRVLEENGFKSVAAKGFQSPGVVVSYSTKEGMVGQFKAQGLQIAGGVPFKLDEEKYVDARKCTFRLGLFGLDKLKDVDGTVRQFEQALKGIVA